MKLVLRILFLLDRVTLRVMYTKRVANLTDMRYRYAETLSM